MPMPDNGHRLQPGDPNLTRRRILALSMAAVGIAAMTILGVVVFRPLISSLKDPKQFQAWVDQQGAFGQIAFVGIMALQVIIAWLPGEPLELGAGYAFGFLEGSLLCMIGIMIGSVFVFLLVRIFGRRFVTLFFSEEKIDSIPLLQDNKRLTLLSFVIFLIPGTPKDILTYGAGLTKMPLPSWLLICGVARIPSVITSTMSGSALGEKRYGFAAIVFGATLLISLGGLLLYRKLSKQSDNKNP